MPDGTAQQLLELRVFTVQPGTRDEFDRISREGTIPLMRRCGITVVAFGPCLNDEDGYYLLRSFASEQERIELSQSVYATEEWNQHYEESVPKMTADYRTAVIPVPSGALDGMLGRV